MTPNHVLKEPGHHAPFAIHASHDRSRGDWIVNCMRSPLSYRVKKAAILAVVCISISSHAETAGVNHNWTTPGGNFGLVELSFTGSMRDAWTLIYTPWFRCQLPMPLYPLLGCSLLALVSPVLGCYVVRRRLKRHQCT